MLTIVLTALAVLVLMAIVAGLCAWLESRDEDESEDILTAEEEFGDDYLPPVARQDRVDH